MAAWWHNLIVAVLLLLAATSGPAQAQSLAAGGVGLRAFGRMASLAPSDVARGPLRGSARPLADQGAPRPEDYSRNPVVRNDTAMAAGSQGAPGDSLRCLIEAIYFEARGEPVEGQVAVGEVVLNRVDAENYPDAVCAVVRQGTGRKHACQFSYTCDGIPEAVTEPRAWTVAADIARRLLDGAPRRVTHDATHYHANYVHPHWARVYPRVATVGRHLFYKQIPGA
ncbi:cell wall hydrolase [Jannaschia rubra]|uniref:Germination-specific amidase n=1 Tax=Jannaschia rubra TaxID=282197 RepID=A0A0M6XQB6_9RHOB|nr:cell wall hydrolase [Jannaschia rubra]CTQ32345.1 Germination-specific amidase [Jannaschia rubra]SFG46634.1 Cell Wall Hydrolase [Jannaschia rubra]